MSKYKYTPEMNEISGFGGGYEDMCRKMVIAGCEWFDNNPNADPKFSGFSNVYGLLLDGNEDAKALTAAIVAPSGGDYTGAMHQAAVSHVMFIRQNGWDKYVEEMSKKKEEK